MRIFLLVVSLLAVVAIASPVQFPMANSRCTLNIPMRKQYFLQALDDNNDGTITMTEMTARMTQFLASGACLGRMPMATTVYSTSKIMQMCDLNSDGDITMDELDAANSCLKAGMNGQLTCTIAKYCGGYQA